MRKVNRKIVWKLLTYLLFSGNIVFENLNRKLVII